MLLSNAEAMGFDPGRQTLIDATVPARLVAGVFPDAAVANQLLRHGTDAVAVHISQFRGRLRVVR